MAIPNDDRHRDYALGVLRQSAADALGQLGRGHADLARRTLADGGALAAEVLRRERIMVPCVGCQRPVVLGEAYCPACGAELPPF